jgi:hypothetical protein
MFGGALIKATLETAINEPKVLKLAFNINKLSLDTFEFAKSQDMEVLLEAKGYKFRFKKKHNDYSHVFAAVVSDDPNDTIVIDNNVIANIAGYSIDPTVSKQVFNKIGFAIKNDNYTGVGNRIRVKFLEKQEDATYNAQKLYETAIKWIDDPYSTNQVINNNILEITLHSELAHLDYTLPANYYYGQEINNVDINTFLSNLLPNANFTVYYPNYTLTKFVIPPTNNLDIIKEATFNVSISCGIYNESNKSSNITLSNVNFVAPTKIVRQLNEYPVNFNKNLIYNISEKFPTITGEMQIAEFINEGEKVLLTGNLNKHYYNSYLVFRGLGEIDLLTLQNSNSNNITLSSQDNINGKTTASSIINKIASRK